jgi:hypothetical protein
MNEMKKTFFNASPAFRSLIVPSVNAQGMIVQISLEEP